MDIETQLLYYNLNGSAIGFVEWSSIYKNSVWTFEGLRTIDTYSVTYILEGRCRYIEPGAEDLQFGPGNLFFCFPDVPHRIEPVAGSQFSEVWVTFGGPVFDLWCSANLLDRRQFHFHLDPVEYWLGRFQSLFAGVGSEAHDQLLIVCALQSLLAEMMSLQSQGRRSREDIEWLNAARLAIDSVERSEDLEIPDIAFRMNMSYSNFRRRFVQLAGTPPGRYHMERLMQRACRSMSESSITNKELAEQYGFCNEFHFSERFKQIVGISPREFRRRLRSNRGKSSPSGAVAPLPSPKRKGMSKNRCPGDSDICVD